MRSIDLSKARAEFPIKVLCAKGYTKLPQLHRLHNSLKNKLKIPLKCGLEYLLGEAFLK